MKMRSRNVVEALFPTGLKTGTDINLWSKNYERSLDRRFVEVTRTRIPHAACRITDAFFYAVLMEIH